MLQGRTVVITWPNSHKDVRLARFRLTDEFRALRTPWLCHILIRFSSTLQDWIPSLCQQL